MTLNDLIARIEKTPSKGARRLVGLIGAPASGKTTLAHDIAERDPTISVVPMDGFHLDNGILEKRGLLARKGAPDTFDAAGFVHLLGRLASGENAIYPVFDRATERSIAGAAEIVEPCHTILVEGNYLLLDRAEWRPLRDMWDLTIKLDVPEDVLRARLLARWHSYGYSDADAVRKAEDNDLPNAKLVNAASFPADLTVSNVILS